jgi:hypothetical protein
MSIVRVGALWLLAITGCGWEVWDDESDRELSVGAPERLRISLAAEDLETLLLVPVRIERLRYVDDEAGYRRERARCVSLATVNRSRFVVDDGEGEFVEVDRLELLLDRGQALDTFLIAKDRGSDAIVADLFDASCEALEGAPLLARARREVRFVDTGEADDADAGEELEP